MSENPSSPSSPQEPRPRSDGYPPPAPPPGSAHEARQSGGYGQAQSGGYGAAAGGGHGARAGSQLSQQDERLWAMLAHLGGLVLAVIAPLVVMLVQGEKSSFVRRQAVEALNFQITLLIATLVSFVSIFVLVGVLLMPIVIIAGLVFLIIGGVQAYGGNDYRYPLNIRMVK